jgi:hypothetical protein
MPKNATNLGCQRICIAPSSGIEDQAYRLHYTLATRRDAFQSLCPLRLCKSRGSRVINMHARELAELAALLALHSPSIAHGAGRIPHGVSEQYWSASKCRLDRWFRVLKQLTQAADQPQLPATLSWPRIQPIVEEILISELLTRLWTAVAVAHDQLNGADDLEPVARNVFASHLDARRRLLTLLAEGRVITQPNATKLNHLRRRVERWTDMLLAHLTGMTNTNEFAFDTGRARDFAEDLDHQSANAQSSNAELDVTGQLMLLSLRASFANDLADGTPNNDLNRRIASALLGAFRDPTDDPTGIVKSLWLERLTRTAIETEDMVEELLRLDDFTLQN